VKFGLTIFPTEHTIPVTPALHVVA